MVTDVKYIMRSLALDISVRKGQANGCIIAGRYGVIPAVPLPTMIKWAITLP